jgi:transposase
LRARRGAKKAIVAVAASMLTAAWHMLRDGAEWHELGPRTSIAPVQPRPPIG